MNQLSKAKENVFVWVSDSRYFEKKPRVYFRAITVLALLISLLLFFLKETLLIILVWLVYFVVYVRSVIEPAKTKYQITEYGINYYGGLITFKQIIAFSIITKKYDQILRIVLQPDGRQYDLVLPKDPKHIKQIVHFLNQKALFLEELPQSGVEKLGRFLGRLTGLSS